MGELIDYELILSIVEYIDDPLKMGRVKCYIPGKVHSSGTEKNAMPWVRPFSMHAYQSFNMPVEGQKIWVLASKTNLNEFWWFPYFETTAITQNFLNAYYDDNPDVLHARDITHAMLSYTDREGYMMRLGGNYVNVKSEAGIDIKSESCHVQIDENCVKLGKSGAYQKGTNGEKLIEYFNSLGTYFHNLADQAKPDSHTGKLTPLFEDIGNALSGIEEKVFCFNNVKGN